MASRTFHKLAALGRELKVVCGSFAPAGTGAPTDVLGRGFSVARTSAGLFTITLQDKFVQMVSFEHGLQLASADDKYTQGGSVSLSSKTVELRVMDKSSAAVADVSANANNRVHFSLTLRNSSVE